MALRIEREKPDSEFGSDMAYENDLSYKKRIKDSRQVRSFIYLVLILFFALCAAVVLRPDLFPFLSYSKVYQTISKYFPDKQHVSSQKKSDPQSAGSIGSKKQHKPVEEETGPKHYNPTPEEIEQAYQAVLDERRGGSIGSNEGSSATDRAGKTSNNPDFVENYSYVISMGVGEEIRTDNIRITESQVLYTDPQGYDIAIDRSEIVSVKRIPKK